MAQEKDKKAKQTGQTQDEVSLQTRDEVSLQTRDEITDLTEWANTQVRGTFIKKEADPKDSKKK